MLEGNGCQRVMKSDEMAKYFGVAQSTVQSWCRDGRIANAEKAGGIWIVRGLPIKRYRVKGRGPQRVSERYLAILKACDKGELCTPQDLNCSSEDFLAYANVLVGQQLLTLKREGERTCNTLGYIITPRGIAYASKKRDLIDLVATAVGVTVAQLSGMP